MALTTNNTFGAAKRLASMLRKSVEVTRMTVGADPGHPTSGVISGAMAAVTQHLLVAYREMLKATAAGFGDGATVEEVRKDSDAYVKLEAEVMRRFGPGTSGAMAKKVMWVASKFGNAGREIPYEMPEVPAGASAAADPEEQK